jgi:tRNA U38,U39,U40 pseudouridine synthase TruA
MIGSIIQQFRGELEDEFQARTMQENKLEIALAPGDGLMLEQVCYDSFNQSAKKKDEIRLTLVTQKEEQQKFRESIISHMLKSEIEERKFSKWLITFDSFCEDYYVQLEKLFR